MNIYNRNTLWKLALLFFAVIIGLFSLLYTQNLVKSLKSEERKKVELWAEATRQLIISPDTSEYLVFLSSFIENNSTVPVILTDGSDSILSVRNFDPVKIKDVRFLKKELSRMKEKNQPIVIEFGDGQFNRIYYRESIILIKLTYYPYVQLSIIILFIIVSYLAFSSSRKAEQNQVWVGMSKETAHQLGTPTSSLAGWIEILQIKHPEISITEELSRDLERLEKVAERFSKIGSRPDLAQENIIAVINQTLDYLKSRTSSKVVIKTDSGKLKEVLVPVNSALFSWVIENVCKNAVDAITGDGDISILISENEQEAVIDISDNGKGIPKSAYKKIFKPGYTTKRTGWGLGLSLAKRIIEEYHDGKIFVRHSEVGKGTSIRIVMKKRIL
ncbi:MAG: ATP-binding protein [Odoribacter sp.]|nr:ATP-binding protein [Odoribacter sp.]